MKMNHVKKNKKTLDKNDVTVFHCTFIGILNKVMCINVILCHV